jgi:hypothetical protein
MKILKCLTVQHKSFGDDYRECDSCSYEFKHKMLFYPLLNTYEHTGECPQCGTESIHEIDEWEAIEYLADAEYNARLDDKGEEFIVDDNMPMPENYLQ